MARSDSVMAGAERAWAEPPEDPPSPLEGKPKGQCVWCGARVVDSDLEAEHGSFHGIFHTTTSVRRCDWDVCETEDENRARYAAVALELAKVDDLIARSGGES